jgi:hypothetical protein
MTTEEDNTNMQTSSTTNNSNNDETELSILNKTLKYYSNLPTLSDDIYSFFLQAIQKGLALLASFPRKHLNDIFLSFKGDL